MNNLIDINVPEISNVLDILLIDKTTNENIIWATNNYIELGEDFKKEQQITKEKLTTISSIHIQPNITKSLLSQKSKKNTISPIWVINQVNNFCDNVWFEKDSPFNKELNKGWETIKDKISFNDNKQWKKYINNIRFIPDCFEGNHLVSRYDTTTGDYIDIKNRIGILDRKLRVITENTNNIEDWTKRAIKAYKSSYGYEFEGDNLLIARINLLMTFIETYEFVWKEKPNKKDIKKIAKIISWNLWQMDGKTNKPPFMKYDIYCYVRDWNLKKILLYKDMK